MNNVKKILVTGMSANLGGVEKFIITYSKEILNYGLKVDFLISDDKCALESEVNKIGAKIIKITEKHSAHPIRFKRQFKQIVKENNYDIIWVNDCSLNSFHYIKLAKKFGIKTRIIHSHNSKNMDKSVKGIIKYLIHLFNKNFVKKYATDYWACSMLAAKFFYKKDLLDKVVIINNGIDIEKFKYNADTREKYRRDLDLNDNFIIGHVGRFHFQKNHIFLLNVFKEFVAKHDDARLVLIGDGEEKENVKAFIMQNGIEDKVLLLGLRDDVNDLMQAMDVFVLPSVFEGLPIVGIEAQCAGLPCIFSNTITRELELTKNASFLSIKKEDCNQWVSKLDALYFSEFNRNDASSIITEKGYNIKNEALKLKKFFINELGE